MGQGTVQAHTSATPPYHGSRQKGGGGGGGDWESNNPTPSHPSTMVTNNTERNNLPAVPALSSMTTYPTAVRHARHGKSDHARTAATSLMHGTTAAAAAYEHHAVSASEAQQRRDAAFRDEMIATAAEEVVTVPAGELECLASGFLSFADYVFVAETMKGLSTLLLSSLSDETMHILNAAASTTAVTAAAASTTSMRTHMLGDVGLSGTGSVRLRPIVTEAMAQLPWSEMRDVLMARGNSRRISKRDSRGSVNNQSLSKVVTATSAMASVYGRTGVERGSRVDSLDGASMKAPSITPTCAPAQQAPWLVSPHVETQPESKEGSHDASAAAVSGEGGASVSSELASHKSNGSSTNDEAVAPTDTPPASAQSPPLLELCPSEENVSLTNTMRSQHQQQQQVNATAAANVKGLTTAAAAATTPTTSMATAGASSAAKGSFFASPIPMALAVPTTIRPLAVEDLNAIVAQDDVLDFFLQAMARKVRGVASKRRVMPSHVVLSFCVVASLRGLAATCKQGQPSAVPSPPATPPPGVLAAAALAGEHAKQGADEEWIAADSVRVRPLSEAESHAKQTRLDALAMLSDDVRRLFEDTRGVLLKVLTTFADAMPLSITSRFSNDYLLPTIPIAASFVGCGVHTRRSKEFFVSMADRVAFLEGRRSFTTSEAMLLGMSQLSNLASQMLSSFAIGAMLGCTARWRELFESGQTNLDEIGDLMEDYARSYCKGYDILCNEAFPALRKQFPNVFIISSFTIKEAEGGRPPIITVAVSTLMKLLFLFAGGLESIRADDRRLMADALKAARQPHQSESEPGKSTTTTATTATTATSPASPPFKSERGASRARSNNGGDADRPPLVGGAAKQGGLLQESSDAHARQQSRTNSGDGSGRTSRRSRVNSLVRFASTSASSCTMTDDVALAATLHVRSATLLVSMGGLICSDPLTHRTNTTAEAARLASAVSRMWRVLFQAAGLLPHGTACPTEMAKWLPLFPLYAVSPEAKRTLLQVYAKTAHQTPLSLGPLQQEDLLRTTADAVLRVIRAEEETAGAANTASEHIAQPAATNQANADGLSGATVASPTDSHHDPHMGSFPAKQRSAATTAATATATATATAVAASHRICPVFSPSSTVSRRWVAAVEAADSGRSRYCSTSQQQQQQQQQLSDAVQLIPAFAEAQRRELLESVAQQAVSSFLPGVSIIKEIHATPLPGGVAMLRAEKLLDHSSSAVQQLLRQHRGSLAVVLSWRKAAVAARASRGTPERPCGSAAHTPSVATTTAAESASAARPFSIPIQVGDELTLRWGAYTRRTARAAAGADAAGDAEAPSIQCELPAQRHGVVVVLRTKAPHQCVVILDSHNYLANLTAEPTAQHRQPQVPNSRTVSARRRQSTQSGTSLGVASLVAAGSAATVAPTILDVLHYRSQVPPFVQVSSTTMCAWTNPRYSGGLLTASAAAQARASRGTAASPAAVSSPLAAGVNAELAVPTLLGWLLGQAPGNDLLFPLPLPPLAFRILGLAAHLGQPLETVRLEAADVSLLHPDFTRSELRQQVMEDVKHFMYAHRTTGAAWDDLHASGSPAIARRQYQRLKSQLVDVFIRFVWNVQSSSTAARQFWTAVLRGLQQTPLLDTPLLAQCCARTVREVLCGPYDHPDIDFSFRASFTLVVHVNSPGSQNAYRKFVRKCVQRVLDEDLSTSEKRLLLRLLTGHTLRTASPLMEVLYLSVPPDFPPIPETPAAHLRGLNTTRRSTTMLLPSHSTMVSAPQQHPAGEDVQPTSVSYPSISSTPTVETRTRTRIDATLQMLPVSHAADNTLVIPNYFEALLMGSYRERVLGAPSVTAAAALRETSLFEKAHDISATATAASTSMALFSEDDYLFAWTSLSAAQQEMLRRRYRETVVRRLRAALYVYLQSHPGNAEAAWQLAEKLGLSSGTAMTNTAAVAVAGNAEGNPPKRGAALMRRHDGQLVFLDGDGGGGEDDGLLGDLDDLLDASSDPFDTDADEDTATASVEDGALEAADVLLDRNAFTVFDARSLDGEDNNNGGGGAGLAEYRFGPRGSAATDSVANGASGLLSQREAEEAEEEQKDTMGLHGYRTAASFCFVDDGPHGDERGGEAGSNGDGSAAAAQPRDTKDTERKASATDCRSSSFSAVAAPPQRASAVVTEGMSTLLQQARAARRSSATSNPSITTRASVSENPSSQPRRASYVLGDSVAAAAAAMRSAGPSRSASLKGVHAVISVPGSRRVSALTESPPRRVSREGPGQAQEAAARETLSETQLLAEVDNGIQELFPEEAPLAV